MSCILKTSIWGLALAAIAAFSAIPAAAAPNGGSSPHIVLVHGGGGGGGGGGMGARGGGGMGGFSGGSRSFASPSFSGGTRSFSSPSINGGTRSFNSNFANGNRSFSNFSNNNFRSSWNNGNWAWHNNNWNHWNNWGGWGWGGWGYPWWGWGIGWGVGWWPGYYYGYDNGPYYNYYGDGYTYDNSSYNTGYNNGAPNTPPPTTADNQNDQGQSEFLGQAIQDFQSGNYKNAMRLAEHAVVDNPRDVEAHAVISLAAFAQKDYRTAATEAHAVVALGGVPSWEQVYSIYQNADTYTDQLRALESYVKANPKAPEGQFLLGVLYMTNGYANEAHEHLAQAAQLTPKDQIAQELVKGNGQPSTANRPVPPSAPTEQ